MGKIVSVVGPSGAGKTSLVNVLEKTGRFVVAYEQHTQRPFQALFKQDARYGLANQIDYLLLRAEQEIELRDERKMGLLDGGLDLDFHGFAKLFHARGLLSAAEYDLCQRLYTVLRSQLPLPDLIIHLHADEETIRARLAGRSRINIASSEDTQLFNRFLTDWLGSLPAEQVLDLDVTREDLLFARSLPVILKRLERLADGEFHI